MDGGAFKFKNIKVIVISLTLLLLALAGARAHAESRFEVLAQMQDWKSKTQARPDLEDREIDLRLDFINRLIFQTESKYQEETLRDFLLKTFEEMTETDQLTNNQSFGSMNEFLISLQTSLATLIEKNENPLIFVQNFTEFSGISEPASADEFSETRSYYDGKNISAAHPLSLEEAANLADEKEIEKTRSSLVEPAWSPFQQNLMNDFTQQ